MDPRDRYNFILILPDQWRGDCLEHMGHPVVRTPYLDELARHGVSFSRAYTQAPSCIPARASLASGLTPYSAGRPGYTERVPWSYTSYMELLKQDGYQTINVGKTHFYPQRLSLGFEINRLYEVPRHEPDFESDYHGWLRRESGDRVRDHARSHHPNAWNVRVWDEPEYLHNTNWIADTAIDELTKRDPTRPFYLQVGFHRPHAPYDPPRAYYDEYRELAMPSPPLGDWARSHVAREAGLTGWSGSLSQRDQVSMQRAYYAHCTHIDDQIGKLLNFLRLSGLEKNTFVIFLSDHGELLGDHGHLRKMSPLEGSARIPLIVRPPTAGRWRRGEISDDLVTHIDVMPTLLSAAGAHVPSFAEGESLTPILEQHAHAPGSRRVRQFLHGEHSSSAHGWQYIVSPTHKYVWESGSGDEYLFDLATDREERINLATCPTPEASAVLEPMRRTLIDLLGRRNRTGIDGDGLVKDGRLQSGTILPETLPSTES
jgi:arylsulfatase A-like enzyme